MELCWLFSCWLACKICRKPIFCHLSLIIENPCTLYVSFQWLIPYGDVDPWMALPWGWHVCKANMKMCVSWLTRLPWIYIYMYIYIYICIYIYVCIYIYTHAFIYIYIYIHVCIYIYVYICIYIWYYTIYTYVYLYIYTYMWIWLVEMWKTRWFPRQTTYKWWVFAHLRQWLPDFIPKWDLMSQICPITKVLVRVEHEFFVWMVIAF